MLIIEVVSAGVMVGVMAPWLLEPCAFMILSRSTPGSVYYQ